MDLESWFEEQFWPLYPSDLAHDKKGPKNLALEELRKLKTNEDTRLKIMQALVAQVNHDRALLRKGQEPDRWPHARAWLHQRRFDNEVEGARQKPVREDKCGCGAWARVTAPNGKRMCEPCYLKIAPIDHLRDYYREHGLAQRKDETRDQWINRLKQIAREGLRRMGRENTVPTASNG